MRRLTFVAISMCALGLAPSQAICQRFTRPEPIGKLPPPIALDTTGMFQAAFARVGDDLFIAGQPTQRALRELKAQGVTTVVNLRTPEEMRTAVSFDEAALVKELGMRYVYLPVRGTPEFPYSPETLTKFSEAVRDADGKVLLHCTIAWRASHLWAAYLIKERGIPVDSALANARAINLMDTHRMGQSGRQPVEDFLNRPLPTIGRPPGQM
jgi:uncharacterized protein (TIGR01244 family)